MKFQEAVALDRDFDYTVGKEHIGNIKVPKYAPMDSLHFVWQGQPAVAVIESVHSNTEEVSYNVVVMVPPSAPNRSFVIKETDIAHQGDDLIMTKKVDLNDLSTNKALIIQPQE